MCVATSFYLVFCICSTFLSYFLLELFRYPNIYSRTKIFIRMPRIRMIPERGFFLYKYDLSENK